MHRSTASSLLLASAVLAAPAASAQLDEGVPTSLNGVGRLSVQTGWRLTSNQTLYEGYYASRPELTPAPASPGGPLLVGSFAFAMTDMVELGVDLFATGERLSLSGQPSLTTLTYGALVGVRYQGVLPSVGPHGLVPFAGILTGPVLAFSAFEGHAPQESFTQAWVGSVGATLRLSARWGLTAEYRLSFVRGPVAGPPGLAPASFNAGGNWLAVGLTHSWAPQPARPVGGGPGF